MGRQGADRVKVKGGLIFVWLPGSHTEYDIRSAYATMIARFDLDNRHLVTDDDVFCDSIGRRGLFEFRDPRSTNKRRDSLGSLMKQFMSLTPRQKSDTKIARNCIYGMTISENTPYRCKVLAQMVTCVTREFMTILCKKFYVLGIRVVCARTDAICLSTRDGVLDGDMIEKVIAETTEEIDRVFLREDNSNELSSFRFQNPIHVVKKNHYSFFVSGSKNNKSVAIGREGTDANNSSPLLVHSSGYQISDRKIDYFDWTRPKNKKNSVNILEEATLSAMVKGLPLVRATYPNPCEPRIVWGDFSVLGTNSLQFDRELVYFDPVKGSWNAWNVVAFDRDTLKLQDGNVFRLCDTQSGIVINEDITSESQQ